MKKLNNIINLIFNCGIWCWKFFFRLVRLPLCFICFWIKLLFYPSIIFLFLLLIAACLLGAAYNYRDIHGSDRYFCFPCLNSLFIVGKTNQCLNIKNPGPYVKYVSDKISTRDILKPELSCKHLIFHYKFLNLTESLLWSLSRMFDFGHVMISLRSNKTSDGILALSLFLVTWLIGGGGLIGSFISFMKYYTDGGWRRWSCLLWNHTVILGWNDNGIKIIDEHINSRSFRIFCWIIYMPERIIVLTSRNVDEVKRKINSYLRPHFWSNPNIRYDVYRGEYDDINELKRLNLVFANSFYVLGEDEDSSHDARALMIQKIINDVMVRRFWYFLSYIFKFSRVKIEIHLASFGLYSQLSRKIEIRENHHAINVIAKSFRHFYVVYRNDCDSWSKRLFANYYAYIYNRSNRVSLRNDNSDRIRLVIVGFSEMGQALAVQAARVSHFTKSDGKSINTYITVFDDNLEFRENEFRSLFPHIDEIPDIHWTFMYDKQVGSDSFMDMINNFDSSDSLTIVIACDNSADGLKLAIPMFNKIKNSNNQDINILLRQDVVGKITQENDEAPILKGSYNKKIRIFGMKDGAGYNAWYRDNKVFELYQFLKDKNYTNDSDWSSLSRYEKNKYQLALDIMEETYAEYVDDKQIGNIVNANNILDNSSIDNHIIKGAYEFVKSNKLK